MQEMTPDWSQALAVIAQAWLWPTPADQARARELLNQLEQYPSYEALPTRLKRKYDAVVKRMRG